MAVNTGIPAVDALGGYVNSITGAAPGAPGATGATGAIDPNAPKAIPQVVTGPDGRPHVQYIDVKTGQVVTDLQHYNILSADGSTITLPATAPTPVTNPTGGTSQTNESHGSGAMDAGPSGSGNRGSINPMNNFGYEHKPGIVSNLGMIPGAIGLGAKAVNAGWNMNNMAATNTARQMLGLSPIGVGATAKGIISDNKGQVSNNAQINGKNYSVGFEAMSPTGVTNLTPMEANERANLLGGIKEAPSAKALTAPNAPQSKLSQITGIPGGLASKALSGLGLTKGFATRALNSIFGVQQATPTAVAAPPGAPPANTSVSNLAAETTPGAVGNPDSAPSARSTVDHPDASPDRNASNNFGYQSTPDNTSTNTNTSTGYAADTYGGMAQTGTPAGTTGPASPAGAATNIGSSPAARAAMGLVSRTPEERAAMEKAIAGELDPHTMKALAEPDQTSPSAIAAQKEFGSIVATMENRATSMKYMGMMDTLAPSQYNSLKAANLAVTNPAFANNQKVLDDQLSNFYAGKIAVPDYSVTSYYNPDIANPAWGVGTNGKVGKQMTQAQQVGYHMFGQLPEYGPDPYAQEAAHAFETMSGTNYQPGKMADDTPSAFSGGGTGTTFGGTPGQSGGGGFTPGGMNSPSGSSASDGGYGGYGGGYSDGSGSSYGGGSGMSGGGGYSPGGLGSPSGSSHDGGGYGSYGGGSTGSQGGLGGPTSNNSGNSGSSSDAGGGMNGSGSSAGAQSRSDGWN